MEEILSLAQGINKIDTFFEMSDNPVKWEIEHRNVEKMRTKLSHLKGSELSMVKQSLTPSGRANLDRYFKTLAD